MNYPTIWFIIKRSKANTHTHTYPHTKWYTFRSNGWSNIKNTIQIDRIHGIWERCTIISLVYSQRFDSNSFRWGFVNRQGYAPFAKSLCKHPQCCFYCISHSSHWKRKRSSLLCSMFIQARDSYKNNIWF